MFQSRSTFITLFYLREVNKGDNIMCIKGQAVGFRFLRSSKSNTNKSKL